MDIVSDGHLPSSPDRILHRTLPGPLLEGRADKEVPKKGGSYRKYTAEGQDHIPPATRYPGNKGGPFQQQLLGVIERQDIHNESPWIGLLPDLNQYENLLQAGDTGSVC